MSAAVTPGTVRIGIDVGGTFTHAVALNGETLSVIGRAKVATTHSSASGVAEGIVQALVKLLEDNQISPAAVSFIAHSTTQATNALLEGDVAKVGILGIGCGANDWLSRLSINIPSVELAPGKSLHTVFEFIPLEGFSESSVAEAVTRLKNAGVQAVAISQAFAVDDSQIEERAASIVRAAGLPTTCSSEVSKLYGLKVRTRTAVINAAMLPKMIETANMTEDSVRAAGIKAPVMVMRSDGGVMDIEAMRKRPILTMLSGPAAGVAAAMMYLNISDGIFVEVGGTSTDISVIRNGKALVKTAEVGGHRVYMRTLDVKTVGVAGGSMIRIDGGKVVDVGPRSAHIAGLGYVCFNKPIGQPRIEFISPKSGDPKDYVAVSDEADKPPRLTLTPTCAANYLDLVPEADCARGDKTASAAVMRTLAGQMQTEPASLAEAILQTTAEKCSPVVRDFVKEYKLDPANLMLVGGGGGAAALVPYLASKMGAESKLAENADVISAIGVALALVRETVERNIVSPKPDDILRIRDEAFAAVQKMGADPSGIEVHVEVDSRANVVRATACGATRLQSTTQNPAVLSAEERRTLVAKSLKVEPRLVSTIASTPYFEVMSAPIVERKLGGIFRSKLQSLRVVDDRGVLRLQVRNGSVEECKAADADKIALELAEAHSRYGDAGKVIPNMMLLAGPRIIDLSGIPELSQISALTRQELESVPPDGKVIVVACLP